MLPFDPDKVEIRPSKHFRNTKLRKWGWDSEELREAIYAAHRVDRVGKNKFEVWIRKDGSKKLVLAYDKQSGIVRVITGTEA